jgi:hypothetical protein
MRQRQLNRVAKATRKAGVAGVACASARKPQSQTDCVVAIFALRKSALRVAAQLLCQSDTFGSPFRPLLRARSSRQRENCHQSLSSGWLGASEFFLGTNRHLLQAVAL